jgi:hypothetical protein
MADSVRSRSRSSGGRASNFLDGFDHEWKVGVEGALAFITELALYSRILLRALSADFRLDRGDVYPFADCRSRRGSRRGGAGAPGWHRGGAGAQKMKIGAFRKTAKANARLRACTTHPKPFAQRNNSGEIRMRRRKFGRVTGRPPHIQ